LKTRRARLTRWSHHEPGTAGYSLPLVIVAALILIAGTAVLANRAGMGLLSSIFQNQSWESREAAEIGMSQFVSELNKETNRYLMLKRTGDDAGIWTNSYNAFVKATRTNPCAAATEPSYVNLDPREGSDTAKDTAYGTWYIQNDGKITRAQGSATRGFRLTGVTRQEITTSGSPLNIYTNRPSGTGKLVLKVQGFAYRNGTQVAESELEKEFELVPKCCKVSFGAAHGGLDYGINPTTERVHLLQFGCIAGAGTGRRRGHGRRLPDPDWQHVDQKYRRKQCEPRDLHCDRNQQLHRQHDRNGDHPDRQSRSEYAGTANLSGR